MFYRTSIFLFILWRIHICIGASKFDCPHPSQITFDKKVATRPGTPETTFPDAVFTLRQRIGAQPWTPLECVRQCLALQECHSVLVLHQSTECYGLPYIETKSLYIDNDANYFVKRCYEVPQTCSSKLWTIESINGFRLLSNEAIVSIIPEVTNEDCSKRLLFPNHGNQLIRSAQFLMNRPKDSYNGFGNWIEGTDQSIGKCILSREDKFTEPESFRVAGKDSWYKENQCFDNNFPKEINRCSYEEYYNQTLKHYDVIIHGISTTECKSRCENERQFNCRGFTTLPLVQGKNIFIYSLGLDDTNSTISCLLHSEDILTHGSWLLGKTIGAVYYRRVTCLNVSVVCTPSSMLVTYLPRSDFRGRIYASGYSDTCSAIGQGKGQPTKLVIPFVEEQKRCGINHAYAITDDGNNHKENKTLMYTLLVIQNNPIIQAQGDRFIRVGCVVPLSYNVTLGANISVENNGNDLYNATGQIPRPIPASAFINTTGSTVAPKVRMYIINEPEDPALLAGGKAAGGAVALGETIELRIEAESANFALDIMAYHLVASSQLGDSSVLLLDSRGCPTGQVDFPPLVRSRIPGKPGISTDTVRLSARFRAFRFPNSHVIKFSVMVQFCPESCEEVICDASTKILHRQKRDTNTNIESEIQEGRTIESFGPEFNQPPEFEYEAANIRIVDNLNGNGPNVLYPSSNDTSQNPYIVVASTENAGRVMEICKEIKDSQDSKIPLELSLIVASNDVYSAENLIYGENNKILVAAVGDPRPSASQHSNMICIHEALFIAITFIWLLVQIVILAACMVVIKRYRSFLEDSQYQKDYHSFDNLGFDNISTTRRVNWADQQDSFRS